MNVVRREVVEEGRVKGGIMAAHVKWVADHSSKEDMQRFQAALPPAVRDAVNSEIIPTDWYDFRQLIAVDRAIVDVFAGGEAAKLRDLGAYSARLNLSALFQSHDIPSSIHEFLENGTRFHSDFQDFGVAQYLRTGQHSGRVIHSNYCSFSPLYCESALGFYREAIRLHGGTDPQVIETECQCRGDKSCTFVVKWR